METLGRLSGLRIAALLSACSLARLVGPAALVAQDPIPPDTVRADTLIGALPDSVRAVFGDSTAQEEDRRVQAFPERRLGVSGISYAVFECDLECILSSTALSLAELLTQRVPGLTSLRAGFFGGPHQALGGPFGPGVVRLYLDGRELAPLESAQPDLLRLSLIYLEHIRVFRQADGYVIDVSSHRHATPRAYSRIAGGSGSPGLQMLNAIFTNGLGRDFTLGGAFDLLDVTELGPKENNRFDFWGRLSWMPGTDRLGIQFDYRSESIQRTAADTADFNRREVMLRVRGDLPSNVQADAWFALAEIRADGAVVRDVRQAGLDIAVAPDWGFVDLGLMWHDDAAYPKASARLRGGLRLGSSVALDGEVAFRSWDGFTTSGLRAGAAYSVRLGIPLTLRADAVTGTVGLPRPMREIADSISRKAVAGTLESEIGPFALYGRAAYQSLSRELPFDAVFDSALTERETEPFPSFEVGGSGPILPLSWLIDGLSPIRLSGFFQRQSVPAPSPLYVPQDLAYGELSWHDEFFDGSLNVWLAGFLDYRSSAVSAGRGDVEPVVLPSYSWMGGHVMLKIADFRLFFRITNPSGLTAQEVARVDFPRITAFGVRWEFFN